MSNVKCYKCGCFQEVGTSTHLFECKKCGAKIFAKRSRQAFLLVAFLALIVVLDLVWNIGDSGGYITMMAVVIAIGAYFSPQSHDPNVTDANRPGQD